MAQLVPGDPVMMMLGEYSVASAEDIEKLREQLGFDDPLHVQYGRYLRWLGTRGLGSLYALAQASRSAYSAAAPPHYRINTGCLGLRNIVRHFDGHYCGL